MVASLGYAITTNARKKAMREMKTVEQLGISPAPWNARKVSREEGFTGFEVYDDNGNYVLFDGDAGFANCNLIAAAPDMYVALRGLLEIVCVDCKSSYEIDGKCVKCPRVVAAEAALKKAGGEE